MRAVIVSRYPRVDTPAWKRQLAARLLDAGFDLNILYTRSATPDHVRAGLREFGLGAAERLVASRLGRGRGAQPAADGGAPETLAAWASARGVDVFRHDRLGDQQCLQRLEGIRPELLILAGADIVPASVLRIPAVGTINGHYALLPRYRGMNVTEWSIFHDDPVGVSTHFVDPGIDTGDILLRDHVAARRGDTLADLRVKHQKTCARLLFESAEKLRAGRIAPTAQRLEEGRQYYRMHPALKQLVERRLASGAYRWLDAEPVDVPTT